MPNDLSNKFHQAEKAVVAFAENEGAAFLAAIEREWVAVKPDALKLGATVASQIMVAAGAVISGGATLPQALESVLPQLPAELKEFEHIVVTLLGLAIADLKAAPAAPAAA